MRRSLLTILIVACLAALIARAEQASGGARHPQWVRTKAGWETRAAIDARPASLLPAVHPGLVALFQLGVSTFALIAFPSRARVIEKPASATEAGVRLRRPKLVKRRLAGIR